MTIHPDALARQKMLNRSESQAKQKEAVKANTKKLGTNQTSKN